MAPTTVHCLLLLMITTLSMALPPSLSATDNDNDPPPPLSLERLMQLHSDRATKAYHQWSASSTDPPPPPHQHQHHISPTPKRYKCILVEDNEGEEVIPTPIATATIPTPHRLDRLRVNDVPSYAAKLREIQRRRMEGRRRQIEWERQMAVVTSTTEVPQPSSAEGGEAIAFPMEVPEEMPPSTTMEPEVGVQIPEEVPSTTPQPNVGFPLRYHQQRFRQVILPRAKGLPPSRRIVSEPIIPERMKVVENELIETTTPPTTMPYLAGVVLAPENCQLIERFARLYRVSDVTAWVKKNCAFARLYLPTASCAEIDALVGSCYPKEQDQQIRHRL